MKPRSYKKKTIGKAKVSTAVKKYVKKATSSLKPEMKRVIDNYTETTIENVVTPYYIYEPSITQGTTVSTRVGNTIKMAGVNVKAMFRNNATNSAYFRVLVLSSDGATDATPATMELFTETNNVGGTSPIVLSGTGAINILYKINNRRFKVHYDHTFKLAATGSTDGKEVMLFHKFVKFGFKTIKFDSNTSGLNDQTTRYYVMFLHSETALDGVGGAIEISGQNKWYFTDS